MSLLGRMPPQSLKHHQQATINGDASIMKKNRKLSQTYIYLLLSFSLSLCLYHLQCDQIGVLLKGLCNKFVNKSKPNLLGLFAKYHFMSRNCCATIWLTWVTFWLLFTSPSGHTIFDCKLQLFSHTFCGQSCKHFMLVNYHSRVIPDWKIPHITTLES